MMVRIFPLLLVCAWLAGCATATAPVEERRPDRYLVAPGDTLSAIAWRYGLDYRDIAAWNRLDSPDLIYAGEYLWLKPPPPEARRALAARARSAPKPERSTSREQAPKPSAPAKPARASGPWRWPTEGRMVSRYNPQMPGGKGIRIGGDLGQPVRAASPGQVVYSGSGLPGYGRLIILKHSDSLLSAYGYLGRILVQEGDSVRSGQTIAELGAGSDNRPVLHFEIRRNGKPVNPLDFVSG